MESREQIIKRACDYYDNRWPIGNTNRIMNFEGEWITADEFNKYALYTIMERIIETHKNLLKLLKD